MDLEKIRIHIEGAEGAIMAMRDGATPEIWKALQVELARAAALADCAKVRSDEQVFIRSLVLARVDQLSAEAAAIPWAAPVDEPRKVVSSDR